MCMWCDFCESKPLILALRSMSFSNLVYTPSATNDGQIILLQSMTAVTAMVANAKLLAIDCRAPAEPRIPDYTSLNIPFDLQPTVLQNSTPHYQYVDLISIPALRNNLLKANDIIDIKEIWKDLSAGELRVWGNTPWDENGWEISESFAEKWWLIMSREVLKSTNFWRGTRGEMPLNIEAIKASLRLGRKPQSESEQPSSRDLCADFGE